MRVHRATIAMQLILAFVAVTAWPARAADVASCIDANWRASDFSHTSTVIGVRGQLQTPFRGEITGISQTTVSAGDIFLRASNNLTGFVQMGWYMGKAGDMPYVTQPTVFVGENIPSRPGYEKLRALTAINLNWGQKYTFRIEEDGYTGSYDFYFNGQKKATSVYGNHFDHKGNAAFNGEVSNNCTAMRARAFSDPPPSTLAWKTETIDWTYFSDHRAADTGFHSVKAGGRATDYAYGG